ncbi:hypothetical protein CBR_g31342 [Chara braunii]|uniref:Uncharacterized protein n=1 Tax=Chara braunii TaxID=69332 RepID=A0A388LEQ2_CHABU|nr:hypothetical protein CBR_g31342 [Chara braunii]|eukprot:GBG80786.1 hypothetical protein CBR_g31342 [Chara braunii]
MERHGDMTSIAPLGNDPLETDIRSEELKEVVATTKSHTFVLDLCEPVDLKLWKPQAFETLNSHLQTWCPSHWTLIVFVPRQHNLSFFASMHHLSFVKLLEGKWVRRNQQKKSFPAGNNLYTEDDRMYILFKGDDLRVNTSVPEHTTYSADLQTSFVGSARETLAALVAPGSRSSGTLKYAWIRTTSVEEPPERSALQSRSGLGEPSQDPTIGSGAMRDENASPERERRPLGLQREATSTGSGDTETTKSAEIQTSSGGGCQPRIVVPPRGATCTETEGRSSVFNTGTGEGAELHGREVGEDMEDGKEAQEGEEEGEEGEEGEDGEEVGETVLIELLEGREGEKADVSIGNNEGEDSEDDARSGESSDEFGRLYEENHEDDVDDDAMAIDRDTSG